jgi:hypothetical protein
LLGSDQEPHVVVEVELGSDHDPHVVGVFDAGPVEVAEPHAQAVPPTEIVPPHLPSPPIGGARGEDWAKAVVKGKEVVHEPEYVTPVESEPQFDPVTVPVDQVPVVVELPLRVE